MKSCVILFVALSMLVRPLWPIVEYVVNYNYIATVLCENKEKPQLQCNGKCYLAKQLEKSSGQDEQNPFGEHNPNTEIQHPVFFQSLLETGLAIQFTSKSDENFNHTSLLFPMLFAEDISQPPEIS
ncbi:hypothetical protein [Flagellimonas algicola]|uniref:Uncharacterized protein n=1 Tax=Flagellimonas algicola TaxID=2583815 RepID=A0ABY2WN88_9FLAO|nr:hypothetical protein [Allomuricauda algicola]TMU56463.1 hypothetical protein FGG15_02690 [Allomuricauda algicola]